jgi:hypothetical protein
MKCGEAVKLESLKKAVVPPFLLIIPFVKLPDFVKLTMQDNLVGEGVQGCVFSIIAIKPGMGKLSTGFKELSSGKPVLEKTIFVEVVL